LRYTPKHFELPARNVDCMSTLPVSDNARGWWLSLPGLLLIGALMTGAMAWWLIAAPVAGFGNTDKHAGHFGLVYLHMLGGTLMLFLGAANLYIGSTRRHFRYHKIFGYSYLIGGSVNAPIAFVLALGKVHDKSRAFTFHLATISDMGIALASLAVAWMAASAMAFRAARNKRFDSHRAWMIRSYVLTWSFVLCRLVGRVPGAGDIGDGAGIVWLSWVVPLFLCEIGLQWHAGAGKAIKPDAIRSTA